MKGFNNMFDVFMIILNASLLVAWSRWFAQKVGWLKIQNPEILIYSKYVYLLFTILSVILIINYGSNVYAIYSPSLGF